MSTPNAPLGRGAAQTSSAKRELRYAGAAAIGIGSYLFWPSLAHDILAENFLPHFYCHWGKPGLVWTHVVADSLIGLAYGKRVRNTLMRLCESPGPKYSGESYPMSS